MSLVQKHKVLAYRRNKYEKDQAAFIRSYPDSNCFARRYALVADIYIAELETYVPNEIIDDYTYSELFRQVLSLIEETFRPDHFNSVITGELIRWLNFGFIEWLVSHQNELKRRLTWNQVCELQYNWMGWRICFIPEKTIREMWYYNDEKQKEDMYEIYGKQKSDS